MNYTLTLCDHRYMKNTFTAQIIQLILYIVDSHDAFCCYLEQVPLLNIQNTLPLYITQSEALHIR